MSKSPPPPAPPNGPSDQQDDAGSAVENEPGRGELPPTRKRADIANRRADSLRRLASAPAVLLYTAREAKGLIAYRDPDGLNRLTTYDLKQRSLRIPPTAAETASAEAHETEVAKATTVLEAGLRKS